MSKIKWGNVIQAGAKVLADRLDDRRGGGTATIDRPAPTSRPKPTPTPAPVATGTDLDILVAPRGSEALANAENRADTQVAVERRLFKALDRAAAHLNEQPGPCTVTVRVAAGHFPGKARSGTWLVPKIDAADSTLHILGGYDADWSTRRPFDTRSFLDAAEDRTAPMLQFSRNSRLRELVLSGLVLDAGASNRYDNDDQLLTGQTNAYELLAFSYLEVENLVIADNTFANAGHRVAETLVRAMSDSAEIHVRNNLILNGIIAWRAFTAKFRHVPARYVIEHNSFILNWPHSPDRTTSNPAALEIGDKYTAGQVDIRRNLFAYNAGGAIHPGFDDTVGPKMSIHENLFWGNGTLFEVDDPETAAIVGKFNRGRNHTPFSAIDVEDEFSWDTADNVSIDPELRIQIRPFEGFNSVDAPEPAGDEPEDSADDDGHDLGSDLRSSFADLSWKDDDEDGVFRSDGFAPRLYVDAPELPFPRAEAAKAYGASPDRITN